MDMLTVCKVCMEMPTKTSPVSIAHIFEFNVCMEMLPAYLTVSLAHILYSEHGHAHITYSEDVSMAITVYTEHADAGVPEALRALRECASSSTFSQETLRKACNGDLPEGEALEKYKCYTLCVQKTVGIMSEAGVVDPKKAAETLVDEQEKQEMLEIASKCKFDEMEGATCAKAFAVDQCYSSKNKKMYQKNCSDLMDKTFS
ncbi:Pheromone-binding protein-related protein 6 [Frankliniella fusca]|uniref:Pheromone-binding protein-related protein 6 n=1 Tax=Frankliniella fusca TaxID=407009 RepID=A0AAE1GTR6_9NEOP|nr:Pheromone-binding protein-related protein 6 [Frankliniella fusca]